MASYSANAKNLHHLAQGGRERLHPVFLPHFLLLDQLKTGRKLRSTQPVEDLDEQIASTQQSRCSFLDDQFHRHPKQAGVGGGELQLGTVFSGRT
jgi:hypothetical protein